MKLKQIAILVFVLLFGFSIFTFTVGFHSIDLAHNYQRLDIDETKYQEAGAFRGTTSFEGLYRLGVRYLIFSLAGTLISGYMLGWLINDK